MEGTTFFRKRMINIFGKEGSCHPKTAFDAHGQVILERIIDTDQGVIDFSGNAKGLYYLKITGYSWSETAKIILK